jgi:hypothetical protein
LRPSHEVHVGLVEQDRLKLGLRRVVLDCDAFVGLLVASLASCENASWSFSARFASLTFFSSYPSSMRSCRVLTQRAATGTVGALLDALLDEELLGGEHFDARTCPCRVTRFHVPL